MNQATNAATALEWELSALPPGRTERQNLQLGIFHSLWGCPDRQNFSYSDAFIDYYLDQHIRIQVYGLNLKTHRDLVDLILFIKDNTSLPRKDVINKLNDDCSFWLGPASDSADHALEIAIGIWLMINIDNWEATETLHGYIRRLFPKEEEILNVLPFPLDFNAYDLERIGGFNIVWTDCLQEHLSLEVRHSYKALKVFHLTSFIQNYQYTSDNQIFPPGFLEETTQTLALLFPVSHIDCRKWVHRLRRSKNLDLEAALFLTASRDLKNYRYWGHKLRAIKEEFDSTEPTTFRQWIHDKRKPNMRYTFWIAVTALVLALVFGLTQTITGIIQTVVALRSS